MNASVRNSNLTAILEVLWNPKLRAASRKDHPFEVHNFLLGTWVGWYAAENDNDRQERVTNEWLLGS